VVRVLRTGFQRSPAFRSGVAADAHSVAKCVGLAEMVEQAGTRFEVGGRAAVGRVLVAHNEQAHGTVHAQ